MSASLVAKLQLDIAGYQAALARSDADLAKWKERSTRNVNAVGEAHANLARNAGGGGGNRGLANAAMQAQDIAVQLQMGTAESIILGQQGSQLLSAFGAGGAIAGGALAIGAAFHTVRENAVQAFQDILKKSQELNANSALLVQGTNASNLAENLAHVRELTTEINAALKNVTPSAETGFAGHLNEMKMWLLNGGNPREQQAKLMEQQAAAAEIQGRMVDQALVASKKALDVENLRAAGRMKEADELARAIKLDEELARIDAMRIQEWAKDVFKKQASERSAAEAKQEQNADDDAQAKKLEAAEKRLSDEKLKAAEEQMTLEERIAAVQQQIAQVKPARQETFSILKAETEKVELQAKLNRLLDEQSTKIQQATMEIEKEIQAEYRLAEAERKVVAEKQKQRNATRESLMADMEELRMRARGNDKGADKLERERRIAEQAAQIQKETGASPEQALKLARERAALEDRIERRQNGEGSHIGGVRNKKMMDDLDSGISGFHRNQMKRPLKPGEKPPPGYGPGDLVPVHPNDLASRGRKPGRMMGGENEGALSDRAARNAAMQDARETRDTSNRDIAEKIYMLLQQTLT
jgi:hypothetical protein